MFLSQQILGKITVSSVWSNVWPYLVALLLFALLISIHELGHFLVAKWCGIQVNEFAIGFGPKLLSRKKGETLYSLRLLPIGGYCAMEGESEKSGDAHAYCNQPKWKRLLVCLAGGFNNLVLGFFLLLLLLVLSGRFGTTTVAWFAENASSHQAGLEIGDQILELDGRSVFCVSDISYMLMNSEDDTVQMRVRRDGQEVTLNAVKFGMQELDGHRYIDLDFKVYGREVSLRNTGYLLKEAALETVSVARLVWITLLDMIRGRYGLNELMGPVGTISTVGQAAREDLSSLVYIMALITVNLGICNLLPLPALDGGRVAILIAESILRREIPEKYEALIHAVGLVLLLMLMLVISGNDILRLIRGRMLL